MYALHEIGLYRKPFKLTIQFIFSFMICQAWVYVQFADFFVMRVSNCFQHGIRWIVRPCAALKAMGSESKSFIAPTFSRSRAIIVSDGSALGYSVTSLSLVTTAEKKRARARGNFVRPKYDVNDVEKRVVTLRTNAASVPDVNLNNLGCFWFWQLWKYAHVERFWSAFLRNWK